MADDERIINIALHGALKDAFIEWLDGRGLDLSPPIPTGDGDTFHVVMPRWERDDPKQSLPIPCRHDERCCTVHKTHSMPHIGCILR